ncbi:protein kinase domain-containing protein [Streptomyces sp. NPDC003374]
MGEVFAGRYELADPIGRGGVGAVWRAWDHRRRRYVAAKVLQQSDAHSLLRFVREQALRIDHPHVLAPASWAADDDKVLFTMDLVAGGSLVHLVGDYGPLPPAFVAGLLDQLLSGLAAVHAEEVVHRDIKPANVLLEATGTARPRLRLSDFGIAMRLGEPRLTDTNLVVGTPGWLAPEQLMGAEPDFPADLFAVGLVALYLLQGAKPDAKALVEYFAEHGTPSAPQGVPEPLWQVVATLLQPDPEARFRTATGARKALASAAELLDEPGPDDELIEIFDQLGPLPPGFGPDGPLRRDRPGAPPAPAPAGTGPDAGTDTGADAGTGASADADVGPGAGSGMDAGPSTTGAGATGAGTADSGTGTSRGSGPAPEARAASAPAAGTGTGTGADAGAAPGTRSAARPVPGAEPGSAPADAHAGPPYGPLYAPTGSGRDADTGPGGGTGNTDSGADTSTGTGGPDSDPRLDLRWDSSATTVPNGARRPLAEPGPPAGMSDTGSFHLPPPHTGAHHPGGGPSAAHAPAHALRSPGPRTPPHPTGAHPAAAVPPRADTVTAAYTAEVPRSPVPAPAPSRHRAARPRRPGPPARVAVPLLLLALACYAVGFFALTRI